MARDYPEAIPRPVLAAAAALVAFSIGITAIARFAPHDPPAPLPMNGSARALRFADLDGGRVEVRDAASGIVLTLLQPGEGGFVRATLRSLVRERRRQGVGDQSPFEVAVLSPSHVVLADPSTGRQVPLEAFGPTNAAAFAKFVRAPVIPPTEAPWKTP